jgi:hypothetical protein
VKILLQNVDGNLVTEVDAALPLNIINWENELRKAVGVAQTMVSRDAVLLVLLGKALWGEATALRTHPT